MEYIMILMHEFIGVYFKYSLYTLYTVVTTKNIFFFFFFTKVVLMAWKI